MKLTPIPHKNIGEIVASDFSTAKVFKKYGIDFCCHGDTQLTTACQQLGLNVEEVEKEIHALPAQKKGNIPFEQWPMDLLIDYVLKIHHRGIRKNGPGLLLLIEKVKSLHGAQHPELEELHQLVRFSLEDLEMHLSKEENVLFPYLLDLFNASEEERHIGPMHCGTVQNPIRVMRMEHANEGDRYFHIKELTHNFAVPTDGCASYRLMMEELEDFVDRLFEHIHIENNIIFPRAIEMEPRFVQING